MRISAGRTFYAVTASKTEAEGRPWCEEQQGGQCV